MHWSDEIVDSLRLRGKDHVIATGTSISGIPHVGNASDVIRGDCVRKALTQVGLKAELIWVSDDSDPFRKVPKGMENLGDYLGFPVKDIPSPDGSDIGYVRHLVEPFIADLKSYGVEPTVYSGTDLYRSGKLNEQIETAFEKSHEIAEILNKFRREPLPEGWVPWTPICEGCGRISTTNAVSVDGLKVEYVCETTDISGGTAKGCGHQGVSDALSGMGKLPWRVEWAARWAAFKVTCEPFGKDHAVAGASYDTSKIISSEIFSWEAPVPVVYEFFTLNGSKISSSRGNVITLGDWLKIAEPEVLKYFMYKRLAKARDINLRMVTNLVDEYDMCERAYFKKEEDPDGSKSRIYELSQVGKPRYLNIPFTFCAVLSQIAAEDELDKKAKASGYEGYDLERLKQRVELAGQWVSMYGPEYLRFTLNKRDHTIQEYESLPLENRKALHALVDEVRKNHDPVKLHKIIYETARSNNLKPPELFKSIYQSLIGKERGPKAASFLLGLGYEELKDRYPPVN